MKDRALSKEEIGNDEAADNLITMTGNQKEFYRRQTISTRNQLTPIELMWFNHCSIPGIFINLTSLYLAHSQR